MFLLSIIMLIKKGIETHKINNIFKFNYGDISIKPNFLYFTMQFLFV
jgi:hypothetical protein